MTAYSSPLFCASCQKSLPVGAIFCPACGHRQPPATSPLWSSERRLVTILFADLASFTAASEDADPEDVVDMLNQIFTRLMAECDREGGYLDKTVGDQLMVLFGAPRAHEDDPVRAVRAALAMQAAMDELAPIMLEKVNATCKLHIGINTGAVVWGQVGPAGKTAPTVIGDAVNLACRLQQLSDGGQILVSEAIYLYTRRFFEYEPLDSIRVKGKTDLIPVYSPLHARDRATSHRQLIETAIPLTERDRELEALHAHWSRAVAGLPQTVLVTGEAGLGKTRLLAEFVNGLDTYVADPARGSTLKQPWILDTYCESASNNDYHPLANLLRQLFSLTSDDSDLVRRRKVKDRAQILGMTGDSVIPLLGYLLGWYGDGAGLTDERRLLDYLRTTAVDTAVELFLKQSTRRPTLLLIDDLQWADVDTLEWLNRLISACQETAREWGDHQLMLLVASRPQGGTSTPPPPVGNVLSLSPLSDLACRDLIQRLLPGRGLNLSLIKRLGQESGGNPFYLMEAVRGLVQSGQLVRQNGTWQLTRPVDQVEIPQSVEGLVMASLDALDPAARSVLQHASVIGIHFSYHLLSAIIPAQDLDDRLTDLEQRGLITRISGDGTERSFAFAQSMVREVAYRSILRKTRRELHDRIAHLTEKESPLETNSLEALAHHYAAGGNQEKMVMYNWLVGQGAMARFDFDQAYHHLRTAWDTLQEMPDRDPTTYRGVTEALGDVSTFTGNFAQAAVCYQTIRNLIGKDSEELAAFHHKLGRLHFYQDNAEAASEDYRQALELTSSDSALTAQIHAEMRLMFDWV